MNHTGTQQIETERLILRKFIKDDSFDMLRNWIADSDVQKAYGEPVYTTHDEVDALLDIWIESYEKPKTYKWAIIKKSSNENIGLVGFCRIYENEQAAEIEYCIGKKEWGKGYATEAVQAVINYAFSTVGFRKIDAFYSKSNQRSGRVLEKTMSFEPTGALRFREGEYDSDKHISYSVINTKFVGEPI